MLVFSGHLCKRLHLCSINWSVATPSEFWGGKGKALIWRRKWQPTPVLLPGESHGRRTLVGYSPWGRKELDTTERLHFHFHFTLYGDAGRPRLGSNPGSEVFTTGQPRHLWRAQTVAVCGPWRLGLSQDQRTGRGGNAIRVNTCHTFPLRTTR